MGELRVYALAGHCRFWHALHCEDFFLGGDQRLPAVRVSKFAHVPASGAMQMQNDSERVAGPVVFINYAHESDTLRDAVNELALSLTANGVTV